MTLFQLHKTLLFTTHELSSNHTRTHYILKFTKIPNVVLITLASKLENALTPHTPPNHEHEEPIFAVPGPLEGGSTNILVLLWHLSRIKHPKPRIRISKPT